MRYIDIETPGGPEGLVLRHGSPPQAGTGEVLIAVAASGVNRPDIRQRQGSYPPPPGASPIPGLEVSGTVTSVGNGVTWPAVGDQVCALTPGGGYAEICKAPAAHCLPRPEGLDLETAAAVPETFFTVWYNLFMRAGLKAGETVLIHGGTSGIGTTALQLAAALGAVPYATASGEKKCQVCRDLGAVATIDRSSQDFEPLLKELTGERGIDVILDIVGGDYVAKNLRLLASHGRLAQVSFIKESKVTIDARLLMSKCLTWTGSTLRPRSDEEKAEIARQLRREVWPLLSTGRVKPLVHARFPLDQAAAAHSLMESGDLIGKIVLIPPT
ncbi:NAD(P)H-quinone oxidoreductase [Algihabitans albus]|uniref:NAD(P)H-quinone oxidoreductase n=1 Tax=Algihabitans albus TaxID=2164067 RepID=UPI000E5CFA1B|nr:NAD(P)H-quinone oxidoreductase [Algihabitans albus]